MSEKDDQAAPAGGNPGNSGDDRSEGAILAGEMNRLAQVVRQVAENQQILAQSTAGEVQKLSDSLMPVFASLHLVKNIQRRMLVLLRRSDPQSYDAVFDPLADDMRRALETNATLQRISGTETGNSFTRAVEQVLESDWPDICREVQELSEPDS